MSGIIPSTNIDPTVKLQGLNPNGGDNTAFVDAVTLNGTLVTNGSFELPVTSSYVYQPTGGTWGFTGNSGMRWLLGTYTQSFNRRHRQWGHLFGGRYKAQLIDERSPGYLVQACNYVHLNPKRAGLVGNEARLETYPWSSYPGYFKPRLRAEWLRTDRGEKSARVFAAHGSDLCRGPGGRISTAATWLEIGQRRLSRLANG